MKKKRKPWGSNRAATADPPLNPHTLAAHGPNPAEHLLQICDRVLAIAEHAVMLPSSRSKTRSSKTSA